MDSINRVLRIGLAAAILALAPAVMADETSVGKSGKDAHIVQRILAFNDAEQRAAANVSGKISWPAMAQLAERMRADHAAVGAKFAGLSSADSAATANDSAQIPDADLSGLSGEDLERAYINRAVASHEAMLIAVYGALANASSPELQGQLLATRTEVAAHLRAARDLQRVQWVLDTIKQQRAEIAKEIGQ